MIAKRLAKGDELVGKRCQAGCGRRLAIGQVVLAHRAGSLSWDKQVIAFHRRCIERVLAAAPPDCDSEQYEAVRARLAAGGPLFEVAVSG